ncbi:MAG TPA: substrate-binding domain-containing protein [Acidothermaceae bacterium]
MAVSGAVRTTHGRGSRRPTRDHRVLVDTVREPAGPRRTDTVAIVVPEPESRIFTDPFFDQMIRAITQTCAQAGVLALAMVVSGNEDQVARFLSGGRTDGAVLMSVHGDDPLLDIVERSGLPAVLSGRPPAGRRLPYVDADNRGGGQLAVSRLVETGRRRIVTIAGPPEMCAGADRLAGARRGCPDLGDDRVEHGDFSAASGERAMRRLLERCPDLDAVFAANDQMASGALQGLRAAGRRVPDDVAVVGFDDLGASECDPPLTSVRQPVVELGRQLGATLLARLSGARPSAGVVLPTELVVRQSA